MDVKGMYFMANTFKKRPQLYDNNNIKKAAKQPPKMGPKIGMKA